ncbi:MAG: hypothetical protein PVF56_16660 [Desulfobacterales bacterium]
MIVIKILLILIAIAVIFCLSLAVVCLWSMSRESQLPDIEDIEATREKI